MLTSDDIKKIGQEVGKVIEHNVNPVIDELRTHVDKGFGRMDKRFDELDERLTIVEHKLDRALYHDLDRHERWIRQLAQKVGVQLSAE